MKEATQEYSETIAKMTMVDAIKAIQSESFGFVFECAYYHSNVREICKNDLLRDHWRQMWLGVQHGNGYKMQDQPLLHPFDLIGGYYFYCEALMLLEKGCDKAHPEVLEYYNKAVGFNNFHAMKTLCCLSLEQHTPPDRIMELIGHAQKFVGLYLTPACLLLTELYLRLASSLENSQLSSMFALQYVCLAEKLVPHSTQSIANVYYGKSLTQEYPEYKNWSDVRNGIASGLSFQEINCAFNNATKTYQEMTEFQKVERALRV